MICWNDNIFQFWDCTTLRQVENYISLQTELNHISPYIPKGVGCFINWSRFVQSGYFHTTENKYYAKQKIPNTNQKIHNTNQKTPNTFWRCWYYATTLNYLIYVFNICHVLVVHMSLEENGLDYLSSPLFWICSERQKSPLFTKLRCYMIVSGGNSLHWIPVRK